MVFTVSTTLKEFCPLRLKRGRVYVLGKYPADRFIPVGVGKGYVKHFEACRAKQKAVRVTNKEVPIRENKQASVPLSSQESSLGIP